MIIPNDYSSMENTTSLFDFPKLEITNKIRLIELFGGIGSQAMALRDIGADFEHYRLVEFDKYAVRSYNAIHGTNFETADIRNVHGADLGITEREKYTYILTYSFPCTDLSVAGKMMGMSKAEWEKGNSTRSGLLWEVERILKELPSNELPQVLLMENVPQVHAEQNKEDFDSWCDFLRRKGYYNFYRDLNAKDYGIPQSRDRCFMVSILSDEFIEYDFPEGKRLDKRMKDFLETEVEEKYYIESDKARKLIVDLVHRGEIGEIKETLLMKNMVDKTAEASARVTDIATTLLARDYKGVNNFDANGVIEKSEVRVVGMMDNTTDHTFESANRVYDKNALCPTIPTGCGGGHTPKLIDEKFCCAMRGRNPVRPKSREVGLPTEQRLEIAPQGIVNTLTTVQKDNLCLEIKQATKDGAIRCKIGGCFDSSYPDSKTRRGRVQADGDITPTLTASSNENILHIEPEKEKNDSEILYRIRKLTPRESWRLMGYTDADFDKARDAGVSNSQLYKQAGNAIVKQVLMAIFARMLPETQRNVRSA